MVIDTLLSVFLSGCQCGEGSNVGRALSQVQHEIADSKKQLQTLLDKFSSPGALTSSQQQTGAVYACRLSQSSIKSTCACTVFTR
jgi:hypothetical protein